MSPAFVARASQGSRHASSLRALSPRARCGRRELVAARRALVDMVASSSEAGGVVGLDVMPSWRYILIISNI